MLMQVLNYVLLQFQDLEYLTTLSHLNYKRFLQSFWSFYKKKLLTKNTITYLIFSEVEGDKELIVKGLHFFGHNSLKRKKNNRVICQRFD